LVRLRLFRALHTPAVHVLFPRRRNGAAPESAEMGESEPGTRILIVDDDGDACEIASQILRYLGYATECCTDPTEAVRLATRERFGAAIVDLVMPGLSGFDLLTALRATAWNESTPVIALSSFPDYRHRARDAGFAVFIDKPIELAKLRPVMERLAPLDA
jgi:CheY-like chemotaxis protein